MEEHIKADENGGDMSTTKQENLFEIKSTYEEEWEGMPEFSHEDKTGVKSIIVHFDSQEDMEGFSKLVEQTITERTQSIWYPKAKIDSYVDKVYIDES